MKYQFINEKGEHRHELDQKPLFGTSTILNVLAKPLQWWSAELAAVECLEAGTKIESIREEYLTACESGNKKEAIDELQKKYPIFKKARFAHFASKNKSAEKGTDLHAELEQFVKWHIGGKKIKMDFSPKIQPFIDWTEKNVDMFFWSELHCFSERMRTGGISDAGARLKDGMTAIIDFKSSKEAYQGQFIQIAGYDIQISENGGYTANGDKIFEPIKAGAYIVVPFGAKDIQPDIRYNTEELRKGFESALTLHKLLN